MKIKKIFILINIVTILLLAACGKNAQTSWQKQYDLGMQYLEEGDYEQAIVAFTAAIEIDPKQVDSYINLANIYVEQEDYENAVSVLQKGLEDCDETEKLNEKLAEVNQLIAEKEFEASKEETIRLENEKLQELETSYGMIDAEDASSVDQGISNYVFCDTDADGLNELLIVSRDENAAIYAEMYAFSDGELVQCFKEELTEMSYCDALTVRLFYSELLASPCMIAEQQSVWAYTGANEIKSRVYKISTDGLTLSREWVLDDTWTPEQILYDTPRYWDSDTFRQIAAEQQRIGVSYSSISWISANEQEDGSSMQEYWLFQNTVDANGEDAMERTYDLQYSSMDELSEKNATDTFALSDEQSEQMMSRKDLEQSVSKESVRPVLLTLQSLVAGYDGVTINLNDQIEGPNADQYDDYYAAVVGYQSMDEIRVYVKSMVTDEVYERYFKDDRYIERDGKVYLQTNLYEPAWNMDSLEIEDINDEYCKISLDEYLADTYTGTTLITLQKDGDQWRGAQVEEDAINKGYWTFPEDKSMDLLNWVVWN